MNISFDASKLANALQGINSIFRERIIEIYIELKKRHKKSFYNDEYDAVGLSSGKFCEIVFRFLEFEINNGNYTPFDKHINNFPAELTKLTQSPASTGNDSLRILIPRSLLLIYTLRNKRGIGHVGGDIEANAIDISTIIKIIDWVVCELIRIYHNLSLVEAQLIVDSLNVKLLPDVWHIDGKRRILKEGLNYSEMVLIILYNELDNEATVPDLFAWTEYSSLSMFKSKVLCNLHKDKLVEYDDRNGTVKISPKGISRAEEILLKR